MRRWEGGDGMGEQHEIHGYIVTLGTSVLQVKKQHCIFFPLKTLSGHKTACLVGTSAQLHPDVSGQIQCFLTSVLFVRWFGLMEKVFLVLKF